MQSINVKGFEDLLAKQAINEVLVTYCRGVDRCEIEALKSAFWKDAQVHYGQSWAAAYVWAEEVLGFLSSLNRTQHSLSNVLISLNGAAATVESHCHAYHEIETEDGTQDMIVGGRYLDWFEKRGDQWRILRRRYVMDWNQNLKSSAIWDQGIFATLQVIGKRYPDDPLYRQNVNL